MSRIARALAFGKSCVERHGRFILPVFCVAVAGSLAWFDVAHAVTTDDVGTAWNALTNPLDTIMLLMAALFNAIASGVGWMIITLIKVILIPILNYDGFSTSRIIGLGWSLVRDVVNMFVVVILLVIAVLTIVGSPRANWEQQIPRLFIYVIAVNFSRTICGLLLDIGNVIMFQFVNAILDVGAGNFAQLLRLNISGSFADLDGEAALAFQLLASAYLQLALLLAILAVIGIMVLVFLYRIVVLWVLIILSPAAFFLGGIKDVLGQAGSAYGEWWKKFSSAIILGPMLTFFLWLALAAASTGDIVTSENFPVGETETTPGLVLKAFDMSQITGLLLGLVLLVVGMQQAASAAGALGGVAAQFINEGMGMRIVKGAVRLPARELGRQADRRLSPVKGSTFTKELGGSLISSGQSLRQAGILGSVPGRALSEVGNKLQGFGTAQLHEAEHNAEERVKGWSDDRLASELDLAAAGEGNVLLSNNDAQAFAMKRLVTDKTFQKNLEGMMQKKYGKDGGAKFQDIMRNAIATVEHHEEEIIGKDEAAGKAFNATKTRYVHLVGEMGGKSASERQRAHLDSDKTDLRDMSEEAVKDEGVRAHLSTLTRETEDGKTISKLDDVETGKFGDKLKKAALDAPTPTRGKPDEAYAPTQRAATLSRSGTTADDPGTTLIDVRNAVTGGSIVLDGAKPDAIQGGDFTVTSHTYYDKDKKAAVTEPVGQTLAKAIAFSGRDLTLPSNEMDTGAKAQFDLHIGDVINNPNTTVGDRKKAIVARYLVGRDASKFTFTGAHKGEEIEALQDVIKSDPAALRNFRTVASTDQNVQEAVEKAISSGLLTKIKNEAKKYAKTDPKYVALKESVEVMRTAVGHIVAGTGRPPGTKIPDSVRNKNRAIISLDSELA